MVPQVNQEQIVATEFDSARCAMFLLVLTSSSMVTAGFTLFSVFTGIEVLELAVLFADGAAFRKFVVGVTGAADLTFPGVGGGGRFPSSAGLQPVLKVSVMTFLVCSSDTHDAESYFSVFLGHVPSDQAIPVTAPITFYVRLSGHPPSPGYAGNHGG